MIENGKLKLETGNLEQRMREVYELDVYKLAEELSDIVWYSYDKWPQKAQRTIGYQIIRSSDSISVNLAEGYGRYTPPDRKTFYLFMQGDRLKKQKRG